MSSAISTYILLHFILPQKISLVIENIYLLLLLPVCIDVVCVPLGVPGFWCFVSSLGLWLLVIPTLVWPLFWVVVAFRPAGLVSGSNAACCSFVAFLLGFISAS